MIKKQLILILIISTISSGCADIPFEIYNKPSSVVQLNNASDVAYYQTIRKKIYHYAYKNYNAFEQGSVSLTFKILNNGEAVDISFDKGRTNASEKMIDIAVKSVKKASPFPLFPDELKKYPALNIKVVLDFGIDGNFNYEGYTDSNRCLIDKVEMKEIPIVYGKPSLKMFEEARQGKIILGGCFYGKDMPKATYICPVCKKMWYKKEENKNGDGPV